MEDRIEVLRMRTLENPHPSIVHEAKIVLRMLPREDVPDWIEALANINMDYFYDCIDEIISELKEEEEHENDLE